MQTFQVKNSQGEFEYVVAKNHINAIKRVWGKKIDASLSIPTHIQTHADDGVYQLTKSNKYGTFIVANIVCYQM